jgi:hypothetical protein
LITSYLSYIVSHPKPETKHGKNLVKLELKVYKNYYVSKIVNLFWIYINVKVEKPMESEIKLDDDNRKHADKPGQHPSTNFHPNCPHQQERYSEEEEEEDNCEGAIHVGRYKKNITN